ncbi:hypothetical protein F4V57_10435 [Acinetobacter qingfengensis]|uniref:Uncharacterized protein n=1 Tax=Acinetobacter qingfengensis TaxID=1262585 RepID=A0A1E7RCH7_9GAMM|nr:hypothetical protein [Acinetobacter qingfengensis]KAA8732036.1 hypothetical protein F4V57_10435 [Acinetobacter qingfengensis]OEY92260.1 hypothetical protein BJI46_05795 [Acinetobacter qingfengensis]OEY97119.1 hypothetical protein BJI46_01415 [Acinetobacter qingfengensis]
MAYVCETLQLIDNVQTCVSWVAFVEPNLFRSIEINGEQAREIYKQFLKIDLLFVGFVVVAKAAKLL